MIISSYILHNFICFGTVKPEVDGYLFQQLVNIQTSNRRFHNSPLQAGKKFHVFIQKSSIRIKVDGALCSVNLNTPGSLGKINVMNPGNGAHVLRSNFKV